MNASQVQVCPPDIDGAWGALLPRPFGSTLPCAARPLGLRRLSALWTGLAAACLAGIASNLPAAEAGAEASRWTAEKAQAWAGAHPQPVGCNYIPAYAVNQLEMWQAETFDLPSIDRELGWAEGLGFNSVRVFLHDLAWRQDPAGFLDRMDQFLAAASRHRISVLFVIFDGVWNPQPHAGPQPAPIPGVHNSQWVQSPGVAILTNASTHGELEAYVKSVLSRFRNDSRICGWDLFNEPNNGNARSYAAEETPYKEWYSLILLHEVFHWARQIDPAQPLTAGVWRGPWDPKDTGISPVVRFELDNSDVISFHCYEPLETLQTWVGPLQKMGRPIWCTEYMARPKGSRFQTILPYLRQQGMGAFCWGFVAGRSQTRFAWSTWKTPQQGEPPEWFHDILKTDGAPYNAEEVRFIRDLLQASPAGEQVH